MRTVLLLALIILGGQITQAADYVWNPANLLAASAPPNSPHPWTTELVPRPGGAQSPRVTIASGTGYYNYIAIPHSRLPAGTDYKVVMNCEVVTRTTLPKTFYIFARNSVGQGYDIWHKFVADPGVPRAIEFPLNLKTVAGGTWTIYVGCQGTGSLIIDRLAVQEGRGVTTQAPVLNATPVSNLPAGVSAATGYTAFTVDLPPASPVTTLSASGLLTADGATPVNSTIAAANVAGLRNLIAQAKATVGSKKIVIPTGVYRFEAASPIVLDGITDLTIDGQGSEFIFQRLYKGECFNLTNCNRVVWKNLALDWNWEYKRIASLGKVLSLSADQKTVQFEFADLTTAQTLQAANSPWMETYAMDPVTLTSLGKGGKYTINATSLIANGNRITANLAGAIPFTVGSSYMIRHLYYDMIAFKAASSRHITFDGITIYSLPGMGWLITGASHHWRLNNCKIVRRPGSRNPLTTSADGLHSNETAGNLQITNCEFTGLGDDAINLHDNAWQGGLAYGTGNAQLKFLNCPKHRLRLEAGDVIAFYNPDYSPLNQGATVAAVTYAGTPDVYAPTTTTTIDFTAPVPAGLSPLTIARNTKYGTRNVRIAGTVFKYTNGRGILLAGHDSTIESCYFRNVVSTSIQLHTEIVDNHWGEGNGATNIVIRNNTFENTNQGGRWEGAVIYGGANLPWGVTNYPLFHTLLLEGNRYFNAPGPAFSVKSARNVIARNNRVDYNQVPGNVTPYSGTLYVTNATDLALGGNTWVNWITPPNTTGVVYDAASTTNLSALTNRLEVKY
jgi:hypothetical protein